MPLPEVAGTEPTPLVRSRWLAPGVMETSLVGATLKGSCVPTLESIQSEGCRPQPKRSRRCWRRLGGCWMLSGCLRQPGFGSPSPPHGGPERPRVGKCHRGANEMSFGPKDAGVDRDLSCRLGAQVRGKEAKLNRATLRLGDLEAEDEVVAADLQDGCANHPWLSQVSCLGWACSVAGSNGDGREVPSLFCPRRS